MAPAGSSESSPVPRRSSCRDSSGPEEYGIEASGDEGPAPPTAAATPPIGSDVSHHTPALRPQAPYLEANLSSIQTSLRTRHSDAPRHVEAEELNRTRKLLGRAIPRIS